MSLRLKVLLPLVIFSVLLNGYLYGYWLPQSRANMETEYRQSLERHLKSVAEGMTPLLLGHQLDAVYEYFDILRQNNSDWTAIELIDPENRSIYPLRAPTKSEKSGPAQEIQIVRHRIQYLDRDLGTIILTVDFAPRLNEMRRRHGELMTALFLILSAFMVTTAIIVEWVVRRPVNRLARASGRLAEGDFDVPLVKAGNDEVGVLVDSFRRMRDTIQESQAELLQRSYVLMRSERRLEEAQRISHLGSWEIDLGNNKLTWSDEVYRIFGLEPQSFRATYESFLETIHPDDRKAVDAAYTGSLRDGSPYDISHRIVRKIDGEVRYVHEKCEHIKDGSGAVVRSRGTVQDVTDRKRSEEELRESHERLLAVLNSLEAVVYVADMETYEMLFINKYVENLFGNIVGKPCWQGMQVGQTGPCAFCPNRYLLNPDGRPAGVYHWEFQNTVNGRWYDIRDRAIRWIDGRTVRIEIAMDITKRKQTEAELRKLNEELEQRVMARTEEIEKKSAELERMNKIFVGRELRMVELKERIKELQRQAGVNGDQDV